jgi:hypothetical protein
MAARLPLIILLTIFLIVPLCSQQISEETVELSRLFQEFRYQDVIIRAEQILNQNKDIPLSEKCEILRLLALSYYEHQDMQGALRNFCNILHLDGNYRLDPLNNSPKILAFFEEIRRQNADQKQTLNIQPPENRPVLPAALDTDSLQKSARNEMVLSLILPGSGQIRRGEQTRGWLLLSGNTILLGLSIYYIIETNRLNTQYLNTINPDEIPTAYDRYNQAFKRRNIALAGFAFFWLYTQIDFLYTSAPLARERSPALSWRPQFDISGYCGLNFMIQL